MNINAQSTADSDGIKIHTLTIEAGNDYTTKELLTNLFLIMTNQVGNDLVDDNSRTRPAGRLYQFLQELRAETQQPPVSPPEAKPDPAIATAKQNLPDLPAITACGVCKAPVPVEFSYLCFDGVRRCPKCFDVYRNDDRVKAIMKFGSPR